MRLPALKIPYASGWAFITLEFKDCICLLLFLPLDSELLEGRDCVSLIPKPGTVMVTGKETSVELMNWSRTLPWVFTISMSPSALLPERAP